MSESAAPLDKLDMDPNSFVGVSGDESNTVDKSANKETVTDDDLTITVPPQDYTDTVIN